jgi:hypothetical protein
VRPFHIVALEQTALLSVDASLTKLRKVGSLSLLNAMAACEQVAMFLKHPHGFIKPKVPRRPKQGLSPLHHHFHSGGTAHKCVLDCETGFSQTRWKSGRAAGNFLRQLSKLVPSSRNMHGPGLPAVSRLCCDMQLALTSCPMLPHERRLCPPMIYQRWQH